MTTSRADAGIYRPLFQAIAAAPAWQALCFAGGTHYTSAFGRTAQDLADEQEVHLVPVDHFVAGDDPVDVAATAGRATTEFGRALSQHDVDLLFVLGDRTEMLAAALAATILELPIAHLHGGDVTEGAYDNQCRHAITKLAHLHFPALPRHAERIGEMGEEPWRIHMVGALALDGLRRFEPGSVEQVSQAVGLDLSSPTILVLFHPETLAAAPPAEQIDELLAALADLDANLLFIGANADVGHLAVDDAVRAFVASRANAALLPSLSQPLFWSCLTHCRALVGNSSAGILEAASFRLPVVNVGDRQAGRLQPANVINVPTRRVDICRGLKGALASEFAESLSGIENPYGDGCAAQRIIHALSHLPKRELVLRKRWPGT